MGSPSRYFDIFGMKPSFAIDQDILKEKYFEISKKLHPDRPGLSFAGDTSIEEVNKAYDTLKNDLARARYLSNAKKLSVDKKFLEDVLEYEEAISNISSDEDERRVKEDLQRRIAQCKQHLGEEHLAKWGYYERLMKMLNKRKEQENRANVH
ncbi:HSB-LIKE CHAPERONE [Encephalitozoon cuniculi GB-M1]|uniref:HSB-LIKE CHAPERONE n=2 Tax=Encephalitozoon cuniculi TaxID=6035 RepID=Q8SSG5_ENCCU|nr:HscB-like chaperone [Encephalitozoon cuniculi GB-M1]AGE95621.1 hsb-like chaperone [Encephalitozoon cuniculi]KMV66588.1 HscB-like chaperone [Encephalitozoon cuniculi EcunIII-L]UYI28260.1 HscB-like chaperone [Encephalitozoon cuniculi]CAD25099.1 HSB-LIKE CHAPERONE [Encephalitozoon cuniculi GB-M1]